jgi:hypothetical protein
MATAGPVRSHSTQTSEAAWNGSASETKLGDASAGTMRGAFAWVDPDGDPDNKSSYKFIHHGIGVLNGGRGGARIPKADRKPIYDHLARHLRDAGHEPPALD